MVPVLVLVLLIPFDSTNACHVMKSGRYWPCGWRRDGTLEKGLTQMLCSWSFLGLPAWKWCLPSCLQHRSLTPSSCLYHVLPFVSYLYAHPVSPATLLSHRGKRCVFCTFFIVPSMRVCHDKHSVNICRADIIYFELSPHQVQKELFLEKSVFTFPYPIPCPPGLYLVC